MNRHVIGQEWAKKVLSVAVYNHYKRIFNNVPNISPKKGNEEQEVPVANQGGRGRANPQAWAGKYILLFLFQAMLATSLYCFMQIYSPILQLDLLQVTGLGQSHGLGASGTTSQQQPLPPAEEPKSSASSSGSDILDTSSHELRLDKSNILMLGPTGSGIAGYI